MLLDTVRSARRNGRTRLFSPVVGLYVGDVDGMRSREKEGSRSALSPVWTSAQASCVVCWSKLRVDFHGPFIDRSKGVSK